MSNTITITANPITVKAGGVERVINPLDGHADSLSAVFYYGLGRWCQDYVNSKVHATITAACKAAGDKAADDTEGTESAKAKAAKAAMEAFDKEAFRATIDVEAIMAERIAAFASGEFRTVSDAVSFTELENEIYAQPDALKGKPAWKPIKAAFTSAKGLTTAERKTAVLAAFNELPEAIRAALTDTANGAITSRAALAALSVPM